MIVIKNTQKKIPIQIRAIREQLKRILEIIRYGNFGLGIWFTGPGTMHRYNKQYRNKDAATDILSFAALDHEIPGQPPAIQPGSNDLHNLEKKYLGDLILAPSVILAAAAQKGRTFDDHLTRLLIHGVCHLIGYDHELDHDWRRMRAKEAYILKKLHTNA